MPWPNTTSQRSNHDHRLDISSRNVIFLLIHFKINFNFQPCIFKMLPPLSWEPLSLRKQPRKWFQNPLKDLERKWFRLFSKPTLNFKSFEESKLKTTLFQKVLKTRFRKAKSFQKVLISKLARISTRIPKVFATHPPSLIKPIFKATCFEKLWEKKS